MSGTTATIEEPGLTTAAAQERARLIAFYLPQYHPIPENDAWWGRGFTEWTNVTRARSLFRDHHQPHLPADLGFYDLRVPEARRAQADLAREYGIHGFCYYHYWFNGRRVLERPFQEVLGSGEPDFPFCLCWANEDWTRAWDGKSRELLLSQNYSEEDDVAHIRYLLTAFMDERYIRVDGKPLFLVYSASRLPDPLATTKLWRQAAADAGLPGLFLCCVESIHEFPWKNPVESGFDASVGFQPSEEIIRGSALRRSPWWWFLRHRGIARGDKFDHYFNHFIYDYPGYAETVMALPDAPYPRLPCVFPSWDNSARRREGATIFIRENPEVYENWLVHTLKRTYERQTDLVGGEPPVVFINAWNEWAEGNHLEPCQRWGRAYLEATRRALENAGRTTMSLSSMR